MSTRVRAPQRRVRCTACPWTNKRAAEEVDGADQLAPCPSCGAQVVAGSGRAGRPAFDPELKRGEHHVYLLPATLRELERAGKTATSVIEEWAEERRVARSSRSRRATKT